MKYQIKFKHDVENRITHCWVEIREKSLKLGGVALCHPKDQYSREKGRKVALTAAISTLPKQTRKEIWDQYFLSRDYDRARSEYSEYIRLMKVWTANLE